MKGYCLALEKPSAIYAANILIEDRIDADAYNYLYIKEISKLKFSGLKLANITDFYSVEMLTGFENSKYINYTNQGIPFIRCKNIRDNYFDEDDLTYISEEVYNILKRAQLSDDDLLYTKTGSNLGQVCCVPKGMKAIASSNCCFFKKSQNKSIDSHYVSTFLNSKYGKVQTNRAQTKTGQPTIDFQRLKQFLIPIPSPEIQKYIGDKVRKAEELREEAKRLMGELDNKINNLFNFTYSMSSKGTFVSPNLLDEDRLDSSYYSTDNIEAKKTILKFSNIRKLRDIAYITDGDHGKPEFKENGVLFIRNKNVKKYLINLDDVVYIDRAYEDKYLKSSRLQFEDILLTKIGTIGESAVFLGNEGNLNANSALIRVKDRNLISPYCLCAILNSNIYQLILNKESGGGVQSALSLSRLGEIIVPILDKDIQIEIENMFKLYIDKKETVDKLIQEAKQDVEDLIEDNFDMSKIKANS